MKTTVFTKYHIAAGAKMAEFAGYNMPIEFTGINDEHMAVRNGAGVFDVSHMGEIWVKGPRALDLLQRITTNDVAKLYDGKVQYSCMPNGRGGIVDEDALYEALRGKVISGAIIDAYSQEPLTASPLFSLDNVILSPHAGAFTTDALNAMSRMSVDQLFQYVDGATPDNLVTAE